MSAAKKKFKAVLRYASQCTDMGSEGIALWKSDALHTLQRGQPFFILPATPEAYDAQIEAMAKALYESGRGSGEVWKDQSKFMKQASYIEAVAALAAIGIKRPSAQPSSPKPV